MNSVILSGRLTKDPETRYIPDTQTAVSTFTLAVDKFVNGEKKADFPRITVFGKTAEHCEKYLEKGKRVLIMGRIQTGSYKDKSGATVYTTDVVADRVEFIDFKDEQSHASSGASSGVPQGFQAVDDDDIPF